LFNLSAEVKKVADGFQGLDPLKAKRAVAPMSVPRPGS
jgi:hypothetical protein